VARGGNFKAEPYPVGRKLGFFEGFLEKK